MEPTSEQELKQLLDEGRITEEEYQELLEALRQRILVQKPIERSLDPAESVEHERDANKKCSTEKIGKVAFILVLGGFILPTLGYFFVDFALGPNKKPELVPFCCLFGVMELAGFMMGIISWKDGFGKASAIVSGALLALSALLLIKFIA